MQTAGCRSRAAGHEVHLPDLYAGATFRTVEEGVAHAEQLGFENLLEAGEEAAARFPADVVFAGFSLGALIAHKLAQTRAGARGALLYHHGDVPIDIFGDTWPAGVDESHLFTDSSLPEYEADSAGLVVERTLDFLGRV